MGRAGRACGPGLADQLTADIAAALRAGGCVFAEDEAMLLVDSARDAVELTGFVARRVAGEPLEHIVGWAEFAGLRVAVGPGAFVPRRRSELLARVAVDRTAPGAIVVELCCGVGAISAVVTTAVAGVRLHAVDTDPIAAGFARVNLASANATIHEGDLYAPLPRDLRGTVDLIVANAPYVPTDEIDLLPPEARAHEPRACLDGGPDGTAIQRRIALDAPEWLAPQGVLLMETSWNQRDLTAGHLLDAGLTTSVVTDDALNATVVIARPT